MDKRLLSPSLQQSDLKPLLIARWVLFSALSIFLLFTTVRYVYLAKPAGVWLILFCYIWSLLMLIPPRVYTKKQYCNDIQPLLLIPALMMLVFTMDLGFSSVLVLSGAFFVSLMLVHGEWIEHVEVKDIKSISSFVGASIVGIILGGGAAMIYYLPLSVSDFSRFTCVIAFLLMAVIRPFPHVKGKVKCYWEMDLLVIVLCLASFGLVFAMQEFLPLKFKPYVPYMITIVGTVFAALSSNHPLRLSGCLVAVIVWGFLFPDYTATSDKLLFVSLLITVVLLQRRYVILDRSNDGVIKLEDKMDIKQFTLFHNGIIHGEQSYDPRFKGLPLAYMHPTGPLGQLDRLLDLKGDFKQIGVVGLGTGTVSSYFHKGQDVTFFEINPKVIALNKEAKYFTYVDDCEANIQFVEGDALITLQDQKDKQFDLLIIDVYSGSDVPEAFLAPETFDLFAKKMTKDGLLVVHFSGNKKKMGSLIPMLTRNKWYGYFQMDKTDTEGKPKHIIYGKISNFFSNLAGRTNDDDMRRHYERMAGYYETYQDKFHYLKKNSSWAVLARNEKQLAPFKEDSRWDNVKTMHKG